MSMQLGRLPIGSCYGKPTAAVDLFQEGNVFVMLYGYTGSNSNSILKYSTWVCNVYHQFQELYLVNSFHIVKTSTYFMMWLPNSYPGTRSNWGTCFF